MSDSGGLSGDAECPPPAGQFTCTYEYQVPIYCDLETDYCKVDPTGDLYSLACVTRPATCEPAPENCDCLEDPCADNYCGVDEELGGITVLCPLPE